MHCQRWLRYLPSHPFPFQPVSLSRSNTLHSDCSRLIGKLHRHLSHCTAHWTLKGWSDESDLKKTPFLSSICKLMVAYRDRPYRSITRGSCGSDSLHLNLMYRKPLTLWASCTREWLTIIWHLHCSPEIFENLKRITVGTLHGTDSTYGRSYSSLFSLFFTLYPTFTLEK